MKKSEFIEKMIEVIPTPETWCKHQSENAAQQRCIVGAAYRVLSTTRSTTHLYFQVLEEICIAIYGSPVDNHLAVTGFNDRATTTHADVLTMLHRAIHNARQWEDAKESKQQWDDLVHADQTADQVNVEKENEDEVIGIRS